MRSWAELGGELVKLEVFSLRSMASGGAFHRAYLRATQQAFLEAHERAFAYFGGVCYDNLPAAVKKILRGARREETARFIAFRSHWGLESEFCTPAAAHEKGGVESEVGYFRRNHWTPDPQTKDLEELNAQLLAACQQDQQRQIAGPPLRAGAAMRVEQEHLLPLAEEGFDLAEVIFPTVDGMGRVKVRTNFYSVPLRPAPGSRPRSTPVRWNSGTTAGVRLAEQAVREKRTHLGYLEALLAAEVEERKRNTEE